MSFFQRNCRLPTGAVIRLESVSLRAAASGLLGIEHDFAGVADRVRHEFRESANRNFGASTAIDMLILVIMIDEPNRLVLTYAEPSRPGSFRRDS
jgi:hypothetical protein